MPFELRNSYRLASATRAMRPYFGLSSFQDLVAELELNRSVGGLRNRTPPAPGIPTRTPPTARNTAPSWVAYIFDYVFNTGDGAYPVSSDGPNNLRSIIGGFTTTPEGRGRPSDQQVRDAITVYYHGPGDPRTPQNTFFYPAIRTLLGGNPPEAEQGWKKLVAVKVNSPYLNPALKNTDLATVFFNGMPSVELARCVPYLDVRFTFGRSAIEGGRLNAPSIYKFLLGAEQLQKTGAERTIVLGSSAGPTGSVAGMELFSTPQTLINASVNSEQNPSALRATPVLDPFRPFMTLKGVAIDIAPTIGFFSNKTAKLEMVLHDRSRLHEIAEFIKPDFRGNTELVLTYGWSHPDGPEVGNPYADLMNGSRVAETYKIRNSQYTMNESGEMNISLDLFTAGTHDLNTVTITQGEEATRPFQTVVQTIREALAVIQGTSENGQGSQRPVEIRGVQTLNAVMDSQNYLRLSQEQLADLRALRETLNTSRYRNNAGTSTGAAAVRLRNGLDTLFGSNQRRIDGGQVQNLRATIVNDFRNTAAAVLSSRFADDPFYPQGFNPGTGRAPVNLSIRNLSAPAANSATPTPQGGSAARRESAALGTIGGDGAVSLGKLLLNFVGKPLTATGNYEEVQMFFYPFNDSAGYASRLNIGELPINKRFFAEQYLRFRMESISRSANMTLQDFVSWLANTIIDDMGNPAYGISSLFSSTATANRDVEAGSQIRNQSNFQIDLENRLRGVTPNGDFKHPQVQCYVECVPVKTTTPNQGNSPPDFGKKVLRLHFFDRQSTSYSSQAGILQASRAQQLASFGILPTGTGSAVVQQRAQGYQQIIDMAVQSNLIQRTGDEYRIVGGPNRIKEFLYDTMPYIIYGAQGTTIKSAQLSSQQNELLGSVNMIRSLQASPIQANGEQPGGLPLQIIPAELSVNMVGCNLVDIFQQYFIDFKTGTSVDNIYVVNGVSHKIDPGSFTTDLKFVFYDGYGQYRSFLGNITTFRDRIKEEERTNLSNVNMIRTQHRTTPRRRR